MMHRSGFAWLTSAGMLLVGAGVFLLARAAEKGPATRPANRPPNIYEAVAAKGNLKTLARALDAAGLTPNLRGPRRLTLLAPTDEAFAKLPPGKLDMLLKPANRDKLVEVLACHMLPGTVPAGMFRRLRMADTLQGTTMLVRTVNGKAVVDGANVVAADIPASNGVIHEIDRVLEPKDIVGVLEADGQFTTLLAAAKAAGVTDLLEAPDRKLTFFAPTDEAFAVLPPGMVQVLLAPANRARLVDVLEHHVVRGRIRLAGGKLTPLAGPPLEVVDDEGVFLVNGANVLLENIKATNGMVNVIDQVLIPPADGGK